MKTSKNLARSLLPLLLGFVLLCGYGAAARIFVVSNPNDTLSVTSLRGAVIAANRIGGNNTIFLWQTEWGERPGYKPYRLTIQGADEDAARTGDLDITRGNLTIIGRGSNVTIDATGLGDRVFQVITNAQLTLENLTITGGVAPGDDNWDSTSYGGAIFNSGTLMMQNCCITGNSSGSGGYTFLGGVFARPGGSGGGICNEGHAHLSGCIVRNNTTGAGTGPDELGLGSAGGNGGGIYNSGEMTLTDCVISGNVCGQGGLGGVNSGFIVEVGEPCEPGAGGGCGAGIFNAGNLSLTFCTVDDNVGGEGGTGGGEGGPGGYLGGAGGNGGAGGDGGGIFNAAILSLNTCTISDNFSGTGGTGGSVLAEGGGAGGDGGSGGGIYSEGTLNLTSCTITLNQTGAGGTNGDGVLPPSGRLGGQGGDGGGILNSAAVAAVAMRNTLIAQNLVNVGATNGFGFDLAGYFTSHGFNLVGMADGSAGFTNGIHADRVGSDANPLNPLLGPLHANGGPTPTHALLWGSPAIDQGDCVGIHEDQRGRYRPYHYPQIPNVPGGDGSDIGAYELDIPYLSVPR